MLLSFLYLRELVLQFSNRGVYLWVYICTNKLGVYILLNVRFICVRDTVDSAVELRNIYNLFVGIQSCVIC